MIPEDSRRATLPISPSRQHLWDLYKKSVQCHWTVEEVSLTKDVGDFEKLSTGEQRLVKYILAFFATADSLVNENIAQRFSNEVGIVEADYFYGMQISMENIHAEMYSLMLNTLIPSQAERDSLNTAEINYKVIKQMADFTIDTISSEKTFAERVLRMACVEGIFFTGCFCAIYWIARNGAMPGLVHSNELIARDEALHTIFATEIYNMCTIKPSRDAITEIIDEAVTLATDFIIDAIPENLPEMNAINMTKYIKNQADIILSHINEPPMYKEKQPFHFMEQINLPNKTNFFERRVSEYSKVNQASEIDYTNSVDF